MKYACLSDLHIGNNKDSSVFHKIALDYSNWLKDQLIMNDVKTLIIAGDVLHDRVSIGLKSIDCVHKFFDNLKEFDIKISTGNHDCYYLNDSTVQSLSIFKGWPNITVYDEPTLDGDFFYAPWGCSVEEMQPAKILISHLESVGYEMSKGKICTHGIKINDVMEKYQLALSGHFHKAQAKKYYEDRIFRYLGSAYQLNWGESGNTNLLYIIDSDTLKTKMIKNDVSPRFEYVDDISETKKIKNNFISIEVENSMDISEKIAQYSMFNPLNIRTVLKNQKLTIDIEDKDMADFKGVSIPETIDDYVDLIYENNDNMEEQLLVQSKISQLYRNAT